MNPRSNIRVHRWRSLMLALAAIGVLSGCGQSTPSPNAEVVAAGPGLQSVTAPGSGKNEDPKPGNAAEVPATKPATLAEVRQSVDWLTFPKPPGAQWEEIDYLKCDFWLLGSLDEVVAACRKALADHGWVEDKAAIREHDKHRFYEFTKGGFAVSLYLEGKTQSVKVHLHSRGNVDARQLPKPADAKVMAAERTSLALETGAKAEAVAEFFRKELPPLGWRETAEGRSKSNESMSLRFVQNAMECVVTIHLNSQGGTRIVMVNPRIRERFEPADVVAVFVAKDEGKPAGAAEAVRTLDLRTLPRLGEQALKSSTGLRGEYEAWANVAKAIAFYRKTLGDLGWTLVPPLVNVDAHGKLNFEKAGYRLHVDIKNLIEEKNKTGMVRVTLTNFGNVDLRLLPFPPGAEIAQDFRFRRFSTSASEEEIKTHYRQELTKRGWKEVKGVFLEFMQNDVKLVVIIHKPRDGQTPVEMYSKFAGE